MERRNVSRSSGRRVGAAIALLVASACSGSDDGGGEADVADTAGGSAERDGTTSSVATDDGTDGSSTDDEDGSADPPAAEQPAGPLGFATDVFDIPIPADADSEFGAFEDSNELIDAGIDAGVWSEVEGVHALVSVVMGELPPEAIPALDELPRLHYSEVIDRAIGLLDDPSLDDEQAGDLARLVWFFTSDSLTFTETDAAADDAGGGQSEEGASGATAFTPVGLRLQQIPCYQGEVTLFEAEATPYCYDRYEQGDDVVHISRAPGASDITQLIFDIIRVARPGYLSLAGHELQPVHVLVSSRPSPATATDVAGDNAAHVASAVSSVCRVAIFAGNTLTAESLQLDFTIAHELFHCIQGLWSDSNPAAFVQEAGADYFAYEVLGKLCTGPQIALGDKLDAHTAQGSLLDTSYDGWFFWAFLAEHGHLASQSIAQIHEGVYNGASLQTSLPDALSDLPQVLNEFFVRLVGPGLACDFKGSKFTRPIEVKDKGPVPLEVTLVWHGTRYKLNYAEKKLFEQSGDDAGPIGMAEFAKRGDEGEWVITEPEVRTTCDDKKPWIVVVSPSALGVSPPRKLEVDDVKPGGCDPCLIGSWSVDMNSYQERFDARSPIDITITGSYRWTFEPGPPAGGLEFTDQQDTLMQFAGVGVDVGASGAGTYTAIDNQLVSQGYRVSGAGQSVGLPIDASSPFSASGDAGAPYICDGDDLTVVFPDASLDAVRDPATPEGPPYFD